MKRQILITEEIKKILIPANSFHIFQLNESEYIFFSENLQISIIEDPYLAEYFRICKFEGQQITSFLTKQELLSISKVLKRQIDEDPVSFHSIPKENINNLILNISGDCNLRCKYCIIFNGIHKASKDMTFTLAKEAIDKYIFSNKETKGFGIVFFGGEPLLNFKNIEQVVNYCNSVTKNTDKKIGFSIVTNGTILTNKIISFLENNNIPLSISIDGIRHIHDQNRVYKNGLPTYEKVISNVKKLKKSSIKIELCAGITSDIIDLNDFFNALENMELPFSYGFIQQSLKDQNIRSFKLNKKDISHLASQYNTLMEYYFKKILNNEKIFCKNILDSLKVIHNRHGKLVRCTAGKNVITINPDGSIHSCQFLSNIQSASIGTLENGINKSKQKEYSSYNLKDSKICKNCSIKLLCGGGCFADNYIVSNSLYIPANYSCELTRMEWLSLIYLYIRITHQFSEAFIKELLNEESPKGILLE